jgi:hypothetical protein
VALVHHQIEGVDEHGELQLMDHRIRTHGTAAYRSVKRGESNGCHRMHNYVVLRPASFLVKHRENVRHGLVPEDYVRHLTPPVPVTVLHGDVRGNARATKSVVPLNVAP